MKIPVAVEVEIAIDLAVRHYGYDNLIVEREAAAQEALHYHFVEVPAAVQRFLALVFELID